ncbi:MAG: hypothetical protein EPO45_19215 [Sphingobium sp.]|nr:MAG: hypothetical protein EPO45_19215 [Sphingobium sp.]
MTRHYAVPSSFYAAEPPVVCIIGVDGRVGSAVAAAFAKEGWSVHPLSPDGPLPEMRHAVVVDAGAPGLTGYRPAAWGNYFGAVERAVRVIGEAERAGYAAAVLFSTPWIAVRSGDPYADSKALIEDIALSHNRHGRCFVLMDRVGMQNDQAVDPSRFELSVEQAEGQLGERVVAALLHAVPMLATGARKPLPPVLLPKPFADDSRA